MNVGGKRVGAPRAKHSWEVFDRLPPEYRKLLREAPFLVTLTKTENLAPISRMKQSLDRMLRQSCLLTYGPDHPQAGTITLESLDL